jgi:hypothetical protein
VRFLDCLAQDGNVRAACARVGVSRECVYRLKRRDAVFARGWAAALVLARDATAEVLADRALNGVSEAIYYRGELVGERRRFDARLLLAHMARLDRVAEDGLGSGALAAADAARFDELLGTIAGAEPDPEMMPFHDWALGEDAPVLPQDRAEYAGRAARVAERAIRHADEDARDGRTIEELEEAWAREDAIARGEAVEEPEPEPLPEPEEAWAAAADAWDDWHGAAIAAVDAALGGDGTGDGVMEFKSSPLVGRGTAAGGGGGLPSRAFAGACRRSAPSVSAARRHLPASGEEWPLGKLALDRVKCVNTRRGRRTCEGARKRAPAPPGVIWALLRLPRSADLADLGAHVVGLARVGLDRQRASDRGLDVARGLVGLQNVDHVADFHFGAVLHLPFGKRAFLHRHFKLGDGQCGRHSGSS